jgi:hypothetical protein
MKYLFALMDDETRFWIAQEIADSKYMNDAQSLFHKAQELAELANKKPDKLITDGLCSYHDAFSKEFYTNTTPRSEHINTIRLSEDMNNNKMERFNG